MKIFFEAHGTTFDNEAELSSGHNDVDLSPLGHDQARDLGRRYVDMDLQAIYCSDLQRSYKTGVLAFQGRHIPIFVDARLRECDYGKCTRYPATSIKQERSSRLITPFPDGESYTDTAVRMGQFLQDLVKHHGPHETVMIIGHRATQYGLDHHIKKMSLHDAVTSPWTWQPGWIYDLAS